MPLRQLLPALISITLMPIALWMSACDQAAPTRQELLKVSGMHCDACATGIQQAVTGIEGVDSCQASFKDGEVSISYQGTDTITSAIRRIEAMGFAVNSPE